MMMMIIIQYEIRYIRTAAFSFQKLVLSDLSVTQ